MTTIEAEQNQTKPPDDTRLELNLLHQASSRLNAAQNETDLLAVLANPGLNNNVAWAALYQTTDVDAAGNPVWGEVIATWSAGGNAPLPKGMRFHLPQFPFTATWIHSPNQPLFIADAQNDPNLDQNGRATLTQSRSRALAVIPLAQAGKWVGLISLSWEQAHPFSDLEISVYRMYTSLASAIVQNMQLQGQKTGTTSNTLLDISALLNQAEDEEELLKILTQPSMQASVALSTLTYVDSDSAGQPAWAEIVSTWQSEGTRITTDLIAAVWSQIIADSQKSGRPPVSTGSRYYVPEFPFTPLWFTNQNEPQMVANISTDYRVNQEIRDILSQVGIQAVAAIPLASKGRWLGVISLFWTSPHAFTEDQISIYRAFTTLASPAIAGRRQVKEMAEIANQKSAEAARFKTLAENATEAIALCNPQGNLTFANRAGYQLLEYNHAEQNLNGLPLSTLLGDTPPTDNTETETDTIQELLAGWSGETVLKRQDGATFDALLTTVPLQDEENATISIALLMQDLTQQKQAAAWSPIQQNLTRALSTTANQNDALALCLDAALSASTFEQGRLYLVDEASGNFTLAAHQNITDDLLPNITTLHVDMPEAQLLQTNNPIYANAAQISKQPQLAAGLPNVQSVAIVPVLHQTEQIGALHLAASGSDDVPPFAPVPLETIAAHAAGVIALNWAAKELASTKNTTEAALQATNLKTEARLLETRTQSEAVLQKTEAALGLQLREAREQTEAELNKTRADAEVALLTLQKAKSQVETELTETRVKAENDLAQTRSQAKTNIMEAQAAAERDLQSFRARVEESFQQNQVQADTQLQQAEAQLDTTLEAIQTRTQAQLQETQKEAEAALLALQQAKLQVETELAETRTQAKADLQVAEDKAAAQAKTLQNQAKNNLNEARTLAEAALVAANLKAQTELKETRAQAEANLLALQQAKAQVESELEKTRTQTAAELQTTKDEAAAELEKTRAQAAAELEQANAKAAAEIDALQTQTKTDLHEARTLAEAALVAANLKAKTELKETREKAEANILALQQAKAQVEAELEKTRAKAEADLQAAKAEAAATLEQTTIQAKTILTETQTNAAAELDHAQANQTQLLAHVSDWVWQIDANGILTGTNAAVQQMLGYQANQLTGKSVFDLVHPDESESLQTQFSQFEDEPQTGWSNQTITWLHRDGSVRVCSSTLQPLLNRLGQLIGYRGIEQNLTPQKQAQAERAAFINRLQTAADVTEQIVAATGDDTLMQEAVNLLQERLNLYHAQIYGFNASSRELVLKASAGPAAAQLQAEGHKVALDYRRSLVSRAARGWEIVVGNNVTRNPNVAPNPLLPNTQAEMVVPLTAGEKLIGVLDLHADKADFFTQPDIDLYNTLASTIAAALTNLSLGKQQKEAAQEKVVFEQQLVEQKTTYEHKLVETKEQTIHALPTPVIPIMNQIVAIPLIGEIDSTRSRIITGAILNGIKQHKAKVVVLDVSSVPNIDGQVSDYINRTIQAAKLQGVQTIVTGLPDNTTINNE